MMNSGQFGSEVNAQHEVFVFVGKNGKMRKKKKKKTDSKRVPLTEDEEKIAALVQAEE